MKSLLFTGALAATWMVSGCATNTANTTNAQTAGAVGQAVLVTAVDAKCRTEISTQKQWQFAAKAMSAEQRANWEARICSCASQEAVQTTSLTDMALIANSSTRDAAVANIAQRTIATCVSKLTH